MKKQACRNKTPFPPRLIPSSGEGALPKIDRNHAQPRDFTPAPQYKYRSSTN